MKNAEEMPTPGPTAPEKKEEEDSVKQRNRELENLLEQKQKELTEVRLDLAAAESMCEQLKGEVKEKQQNIGQEKVDVREQERLQLKLDAQENKVK